MHAAERNGEERVRNPEGHAEDEPVKVVGEDEVVEKTQVGPRVLVVGQIGKSLLTNVAVAKDGVHRTRAEDVGIHLLVIELWLIPLRRICPFLHILWLSS